MANGKSGNELTVAGLWEDGVALLRSHNDSVVWIAAMFLFVPQLVIGLWIPKGVAPGSFDLWMLPGILLLGLLSLIGRLANIAIFIGGPAAPHTVGDAIWLGLRLIPKALLIIVLTIGCFLPILLAFAAAAAALGMPLGQATKPSLSLVLLMIAGLGIMLYCAVRLVTLDATLVGERSSAWTTLRRAWSMSRGASWTLFGFFFSLAMFAFFGSILLTLVGGVIVTLLFGQAAIGKLIIVSLTAAVSTGVNLLSLSAGVVAYGSLSK